MNSRRIVFRYETPQWESNVQGLLIDENQFIILANDGLSVLALFQ